VVNEVGGLGFHDVDPLYTARVRGGYAGVLSNRHAINWKPRSPP
jgi:hypothetical protein